jgi:hypothetical protein
MIAESQDVYIDTAYTDSPLCIFLFHRPSANTKLLSYVDVDDIFGICEAGPLFDFSIETGAVVSSAAVVAAPSGGILKESMVGGRECHRCQTDLILI